MDFGFLQSIGGNLLFEISVMIIIATFFAYLTKIIKQPIIPAYIITGIVLGPSVLGLVKDSAMVRAMSEIGIIFLLFIVGLEMDLKKLKRVGIVSVIAGTVQVILTFALGYIASLWLGFSSFNAIFLGLIVAFSSTMVVVKLLSEREEIDSLHGRLLVGILLMQDVLVILAMPFVSSIGAFSLFGALKIVIATLILTIFAFIFSRFAMRTIFRFAAKSEELLFLMSLSTCFLFTVVANYFGFSPAIGAFVAGLMLANLPYHFDIIGKVSPLKDFFSTVFFVSLGMQCVIGNFGEVIWPFAALFVVIIVLKPIIVMLLLSLFGYRKHTSFITGLLLGQTSEFSLIIIITAGTLITAEVASLTIILAMLTITLTTYIFQFDEKVYNFFADRIDFLEKLSLWKHIELEYHSKSKAYSIVLVGCDRMGTIILNSFIEKRKHIIVVDSNPEVISLLMKKKVPCMYGDISNASVLKRIDFSKVKAVVSTIPNDEGNKRLIDYAKGINKRIDVLVTAERASAALSLYDAGADFVVLPRMTGGEMVSSIIDKQMLDKRHICNIRKRQMQRLISFNTEH